jgi:hypothetical protein
MRTPARHGPAATTIAWRVASLLVVATLLICAIAGGLLRAGVALPCRRAHGPRRPCWPMPS